MIQAHYKGSFWIKAEIAKLNYYPKSGHCFPDLVEKKDGGIVAEMRSTIWNTQYQKINQSFLETLQTPLKEGLSVLLKGKLSYHQNFGFSIQISHIDPSFTLGEMASEKLKSIFNLKKEGVFYLNKQLSFPELPKRLAIISYNTSKGYQDFIEILDKFSTNYTIPYQLFPSLLQGDKAVNNLLAELSHIEARLDKFDVVLIIRGGGGDVGMNCYDDYFLAKKIATFPIPVLTGIGHSTNETVSEMVAYKNCITPTDLAYEILGYFQEKESLLKAVEEKLNRFSRSFLGNEQYRLSNHQKRLVQQSKMLLQMQHRIIEVVEKQLFKEVNLVVAHSLRLLKEASFLVEDYPKKRIDNEKTVVQYAHSQLEKAILKTQFKAYQDLAVNATKLELLSPERMFKRGFSITTKNGKLVTSKKGLTVGDELRTEFLDGSIISKVENKKKAIPKNRP